MPAGSSLVTPVNVSVNSTPVAGTLLSDSTLIVSVDALVSFVSVLVTQRVITVAETLLICTVLLLETVPDMVHFCLSAHPSVMKLPPSLLVIVAGVALA
jgi:hypothetical protein